jgi:phosphotransferase system enzyme I (PtsI)
MTEHQCEFYLEGFPISEGVAIGKLYILSHPHQDFVPEFSINSEEVDGEIQRYRKALSSSRQDLEQLQVFLSDEGSHEAVTIIDTHIQMLEDPLITTFVEQKIKQMLQNTESVFCSVIGEYEKKFVAIDDTFFKQRLVDVRDVSQRILKHLHPKPPLKQVPSNAVIFAKELIPSHTAEACVSKVCAFISELGGSTSHAALIARAKGIPYVANIHMEKIEKVEGSVAIVDGISGKVILNPSADTLESYQKLKKDIMDEYQRLVNDINLESITRDHQRVHLWANIEKISDLDHPYFRGAEGIGLLRSEFLFSQKEILSLSEELQYHTYDEIIKKAQHLPIIFRVFDIGGDKGFSQENAMEEPNPALGCRAIRFLLHYKELFRIQMRAILKASVRGNVSLLFPLVTDIDELREVKKFIHTVQEELLSEGVAFANHLPIGCMIEMPSAALTCESLAKECDFFSIGTNDLVQYALAMDRSHPFLNANYKPAHPAILKMLKMVIEVGEKYHKRVSICGEMASNPLFTKLLLGLGITHLSCAPRHLPIIKRTIRFISYQDAKTFAEKVLQLESALDIERLLVEDFENTRPSSSV